MAKISIGKFLYGTLFVVVVPSLLTLWAKSARTNVALPAYGTPFVGFALAVCGLALLLLAMLNLWCYGGGLPMNAFPPPRLVTCGTYALLPHPIYTGFGIVCLGLSMATQSAAGFWLVTPSVVLGCAALVFGYEHPDLLERFGYVPKLMPANCETPPSTLERIRFLVLVVLPWLALYEFTIRLPIDGYAFKFAFEDHLPLYPWTILVYQSTYVAVVFAPWCARSRRDLRKLALSAWMAMAVVFPFYWFFPSTAPQHPLTDTNWLTHLVKLEHALDEPSAALPAFHVLWAVFVARLYRPRWLGFSYAVAVALSCITTGMHYIADVVGALVAAPLFLQPLRPWETIRRGTERLANSWREWRIGPIRVINHALYAGAAAFVQAAVVMAALGSGNEWKAFLTAIMGLLGAELWAQWIEGSSRLRRPFGFYGGLIGAAIACLFFQERWTLLAAHSLAAPWTQAIGRMRCLVNGCCHGSPSSSLVGIRVTHKRSRVSHLAHLSAVPIHPTQLYSILGNLLLGLLLARLWTSGCPMSLIAGTYALGNGIARFVEEAYRGEPQTPRTFGLRLYQWMAIACVVLGAVLTTLPSPASPALQLSRFGLGSAIAFALITAAAMGVDFPESNRALARLT